MKRSLYAITIGLIAAMTFMSAPLHADSPKGIGTVTNTKLYDYRLKTGATITVKSVDVTPYEGTVILKVSLSYTNTGNRSHTWYFENTALVDAKGRQYTGMSWWNPNSMKKFRDFIRELQPGMTENIFVYFKVPRQAFVGDVRFCFMSDQDNKPQAPIKIFDKKQSKYDFKIFKMFSTAIWE